MSKEQSTIIKGIAILMMLWYHLFGISNLESLCTPLLYIHGKSFAAYIANACYPVSFFLILSGYGLTYIYHNKLLTANSQSKRLLKAYSLLGCSFCLCQYWSLYQPRCLSK